MENIGCRPADYKDMYIEPFRIGRKGAWAAKYGIGDFWQTTASFSGVGAKAKAIHQAHIEIDGWTWEKIEQYLQS